VPALLAGGVRRFRLEFVREDGQAVARTLAAWRELLAGAIDGRALAARTGATARIGVAQGGMKLLAE
jgi:putative protease